MTELIACVVLPYVASLPNPAPVLPFTNATTLVVWHLTGGDFTFVGGEPLPVVALVGTLNIYVL